MDSSRELVAAAKARGVDARVMNAEALTFESEFDAVFSNAALHWMVHLDKVMAGVFRALKAGGRFVVECGGKGNVKAIREGIEYAFGRPGSGWVCLAEALAFSGCAGNEDVAGRRRFCRGID